jgi:serine/threonine protein phosphatase 1
MSERVIAIGDVHGCAGALRTLLEAVQPSAADTIVMLGDCIDRGPDSRSVIEQVLGLRDVCPLVPLLGNHEEMMLNYFDGRPQPDDWLLCGGAATLRSYGDEPSAAGVPPEHVEFIRSWGDWFETETHFFCHGKYEPHRPLDQQRWHLLRWDSLRDGLPGPHYSGKKAVVGHTPQSSGEILDVGYLCCIDTYCYGGRWLTALDVTTGQVWQANELGRLRT